MSNEFLSAVKYVIKQAWKRIWVCLAAVAIMLTMHISPTWKAQDTTQGEWHGVTVKPAIVAASKVPAGVTAQVELTINIPAQHEWAKERKNGDDRDNYNNLVGINSLGRIAPDSHGANAGAAGENSEGIGFKTYDFISRGGGWFTTAGEIQFNSWAIPLIIQAMQDGSYKVLTDEPDVSFTVKSAVAVKPKPQLKWSVSYLYGTNGSHEVLLGKDLTGWLEVKGGLELESSKVQGKVGVGIGWN